MELVAEDAPVPVPLVKPASIDTPLPNRARNAMDRRPTLPPPIYPPAEVANAILHAAVHPQRDIFLGGGGKMFVVGKAFAPGAGDERGAPQSTSCGRAPVPGRSSIPRRRRPSGSGSRRPRARW